MYMPADNRLVRHLYLIKAASRAPRYSHTEKEVRTETLKMSTAERNYMIYDKELVSIFNRMTKSPFKVEISKPSLVYACRRWNTRTCLQSAQSEVAYRFHREDITFGLSFCPLLLNRRMFGYLI